MADSQLVLCNVLCFLVNKFGKNHAKTLKSAILDFYNADVLSKAKVQLLKDLEKVTSTSFPHVPQYRQGDNRASRDVDDMFLLLTTLDENVSDMLSDLPTYVADGPDNMPSIRIYEGDLGVMMSLLEKLDSKIGMLGSAVSNVARDVHNIQVKVDSLDLSQATTVQLAYPYRPWNVPEGETNNTVSQVVSQSTSKPSQSVTTGKSQHATTTMPIVASTADMVINKPPTHVETVLPITNWASLVSTPNNNRFSVLRTTDDEQSDNGPFIEPRSTRNRRKRQLSIQQRQQQQQQRQDVVVNGDKQLRPPRRPTAPLLVGKSTVVKPSITAAKRIIKKAVFCIDNLSVSYSVNDIRSFITTMGVDVISCFDVKPRRRRNESSPATNRKAFRVCISADDRERFLDESQWPDSVMIYEWFFKSSQPPAEKRLLMEDRLEGVGSGDHVSSALPAAVVGAVGGCQLSDLAVHRDSETMEHDDDDEITIPLDSTVINPHINDGSDN